MSTIYDFSAKALDGEERQLGEFRGKVLLIVNTASQCGFTPQYQGLETLHRKYEPAGFSVLGFPCNQFAKQEPGGPAEIRAFCSLTYGVTFPLFDKIEVNGAHAHPLFQFLKSQRNGFAGMRAIKWNFTKFLVDRQGKVTARFAPMTPPSDIEPSIAGLLQPL